MSMLMQQAVCWMNLNSTRESELNSDVLFIVDGVKIFCHRTILSVSSDMFARILQDHPDDDNIIEVHFPGVDCKSIEFMMDFIYTGALVCDTDSMNNVISLLRELTFRGEITITEKACKSEDMQLSLKNFVAPVEEQVEPCVMVFKEEIEEIASNGDSIEKWDFQADESVLSCEKVVTEAVQNVPGETDISSGPMTSENVNKSRTAIENNSKVETDCFVRRASLRVTNKVKLHMSESCTQSSDSDISEGGSNGSADCDSEYEPPGSDNLREEVASDEIRKKATKVCNNGMLLSKQNHNDKVKEHMHNQEALSIQLVKCRFCDLRFKRHKQRLNHEVKIHGVSRQFPYACNKCDEKFKNSSALQKHSRLHIYGIMLYPCKVCGVTFESQRLREIHSNNHRNKLCKYCKRTVFGRAEAHYESCNSKKRILSTKTPPGFLNIQIRNASNDISTNNKSNLDPSINGGPLRCKYCSKELSSRSKRQLSTHLIRVHGIPKEYCYECPQCDNRFASHYEFIHHKKVHNPGMLPIKCNHCDKYVESILKMMHHMKNEHPEIGRHCKRCNKVIPSSEYRVHRQSHVSLQCNICGRSFKMDSSFKTHQLTHLAQSEWGFKCDQCGQSFKRKDVLELHVMNKHTDRRLMPHLCPHCSAGFRHKSRLVTHMKRHQQLINK